MGQVIDVKPKNELILDYKPKNTLILENKPKITTDKRFTDQIYPSTINKGEPMGLLLALTYPNTFSFTTTFHP